MIEVFHFITPLQFESFQSQQAMIQVLNTLDIKVSYHLIPLISLATIKASQCTGVDDKNQALNQLDYLVSLDFEAMASQGQRIARAFLKALQIQLLVNKQTYSEKLVFDIIESLGADLAMFKEDRNSGIANNALVNNQQHANEFNISKNPTALIFDNGTTDYGLMIENFKTTNLELIINQYLQKQQHSATQLRIIRN